MFASLAGKYFSSLFPAPAATKVSSSHKKITYSCGHSSIPAIFLRVSVVNSISRLLACAIVTYSYMQYSLAISKAKQSTAATSLYRMPVYIQCTRDNNVALTRTRCDYDVRISLLKCKLNLNIFCMSH